MSDMDLNSSLCIMASRSTYLLMTVNKCLQKHLNEIMCKKLTKIPKKKKKLNYCMILKERNILITLKVILNVFKIMINFILKRVYFATFFGIYKDIKKPSLVYIKR